MHAERRIPAETTNVPFPGMAPGRLVTLKGLEATYTDPDGSPLFPQATIRGWIHADLDRFKARCVIKPGGKVLVDLDAFGEWLEERRGAPADRVSGAHRRQVRRRRNAVEPHPVTLALQAGREARKRTGKESR